jgi:hypothetical protein
MSRAPASILGRGRLLAQAGGAAGGARRPQLVVLVHDALPDRVRMDQLTIAWPSPPTRWGYFAPFPSPPLKGNIRTDRCCPPPSNSAVRSVVARRTAALSKHSTRSPSFPPHPRGEVQRVISEGSTRPLDLVLRPFNAIVSQPPSVHFFAKSLRILFHAFADKPISTAGA